LLENQLNDLEYPADAICIDASESVDRIIELIVNELHLKR